MNRWQVAIIVFFVVVVAANVLFVYLAVSNPDPVEASYETSVNR